MPLFLLLNRLFVLSSSSLSIVCVRAPCLCSHVGVHILALLHVCVLHSSLPASDPSGPSDHHRPNARPASYAAQSCSCHHANHHAPDPSDPELHPCARSQSPPGVGAARARIWNNLHAIWVPLHTHALHIGIPNWLNWSIRYINLKFITFVCGQWMYYENWILDSNEGCSPSWYTNLVSLYHPSIPMVKKLAMSSSCNTSLTYTDTGWSSLLG